MLDESNQTPEEPTAKTSNKNVYVHTFKLINLGPSPRRSGLRPAKAGVDYLKIHRKYDKAKIPYQRVMESK
jgi:hypothetical protein